MLPRNAAYERIVEHSRQSLASYLALDAIPETAAIEKVFTLTREFAGESIKLQGKIDAVFETQGGERIIDFKTSSDIHIKDEKYARQLAFYDLLLRANGHAPTGAAIIQVGTEGVKEYPVPLDDETREDLLATLEAVMGELLTGTWREGEPSDYDGLLELFK